MVGIYEHIRTHAYTQVRMHTRKHAHARTHARTHAQTHARTHARTHTHTDTHTHTHTHAHTQARATSLRFNSNEKLADYKDMRETTSISAKSDTLATHQQKSTFDVLQCLFLYRRVGLSQIFQRGHFEPIYPLLLEMLTGWQHLKTRFFRIAFRTRCDWLK